MKEKQQKWFTWPILLVAVLTVLLSVAAADPARAVSNEELEAMHSNVEQAIGEASASGERLSELVPDTLQSEEEESASVKQESPTLSPAEDVTGEEAEEIDTALPEETGEPSAEPSVIPEDTPMPEAAPVVFKVRFLDFAGNLIGAEQSVEEGNGAQAPGGDAVPTPPNQQFTGWDTDAYLDVRADLDVNAQYEDMEAPKETQDTNVVQPSPAAAQPSMEGYFNSLMTYDGQLHVPEVAVAGYDNVEYRSYRYENEGYTWTEWSADLNEAAISQAAPGQDFEVRGTRQDNGETETLRIPASIQKRDLSADVPDYQIEEGEHLPDIQVVYEGFAPGEGEAQLTAPGVVTSEYYPGAPAGEYDIVVSAGSANNYNVYAGYGELTVLQQEAYRVVLGFGSSIYDGKTHAAVVAENTNNYELEFRSHTAGKDDWTVWAAVPQGYTNIGSYEYEARIKGTTDVAGSCIGAIFPRPISVTAASSTKTYDGTPLVASGYTPALTPGTTATGGPLASGDVIIATVAGSQTEPGSSPSIVTSVVIWRNSVNVTANYTITTANGTLKVTPGITASFATVTYDGQVHTPNVVSTESSAPPLEYRMSSDGGSAFTAWSGDLSSVAVMHAGDYLFETRFSGQPGSLVQFSGRINKYPILVTANSAAKDYDGTAITDSGWTVSQNPVAGDLLTATVTGSQRAVGPANQGYLGFSKNVISNIVVKNGSKDRTADYDITARDGYLFINGDPNNKSGIVFYASYSTYDGYTIYPFYINYGDQSRTVEFNYGPSTGNPSAWTSDFSKVGVTDIMGTGVYVWNYRTSDGYSGTTSAGLYRRPLKIATQSQTYAYDGVQHTLSKGSVTSGLVDFHTFVAGSLQPSGKAGPAAGVYTNLSVGVSSLQILDQSGRNVSSNYSVTVIPGTLTILPAPTPAVYKNIVVTLKSGQKTYDGTALREQQYTLSGDAYEAGLPAGYYLSVNVQGTATNVADSAQGNNTAVAKVFDAAGKDVSASYNIDVRPGTLTIAPAPLTVSVQNYTIALNDSAPDYAFSYSGFVNGETQSVIKPGTISCPYVQGSPTGEYEISVSKGRADNYIVPAGKGTLYVVLSPEDMLISTADATVPYNTREHTVPPASNKNNWPLEYRSSENSGTTWTDWEDAPQKYTEAGDYLYEVRFVRGYADDAQGVCSLTIQPLELVISPYSLTKVYDGLLLSSADQSPPHGYIQSGGPADGEMVTIMADGRTRVDAGTSAYTITGVLVAKEDGGDSTPNYAISFTNGSPDGSYTVTPAQLTATMLDETVTAGDPPPTYRVRYSGFVNDENSSVLKTRTNARCDYRQDDPSPAAQYPIDGSGATARNYTLVYVPGTLYVNKAGPSPSTSPSATPTASPTATTSVTPTAAPSGTPAGSPTRTPSGTPAGSPTRTPSGTPTGAPASASTAAPTITHSRFPDTGATGTPAGIPTAAPSKIPANTPSEDKIVAAPTAGASAQANTATVGASASAVTEAVKGQDVVASADVSHEIGEDTGSVGEWALLNLLLLIAGAAIAIWITLAGNRNWGGQQARKADAGKRQQSKGAFVLRLLAITLGIVAAVVFFLTEDLSGQMLVTDVYTVWMAVIIGAQVLCTLVFMKYNDRKANPQDKPPGVE